MASLNVGNLGEFLREQRRTAQLSLRQLADAAGVSNPYLSQIERGLRKPSADILQQLAKALRISAETLYVQAGILDERAPEAAGTRSVILADPSLDERQKQVLIQIYESFRKENGFTENGSKTDPSPGDPSREGPSPDGRSKAGPSPDGRSSERRSQEGRSQGSGLAADASAAADAPQGDDGGSGGASDAGAAPTS
ncbi:helix-turn-helix domain-containing protein [Streptomyces sp. cg36]|uniref:helix-turn-helix domain-containing protein n=1 Tax=Streptomyces sp. cg36 TaxID=3238798 RepID=UPI0034E22A50